MSKPRAVLAALALLVGLLAAFWWLPPGQPEPATVEPSVASGDAVQQLKLARAERDATVWRQEIEAQRYETFLVQLWDRLRKAEDAAQILATLPLQSAILGKPLPPTPIAHHIELITLVPDRQVSAAEWTLFIQSMHQQGYRLVQSEWHHTHFEPAQPHCRSRVTVALHLVNESRHERLVVKGDVLVEWSTHEDGTTPYPWKVDLSQLTLQRRQGEPPFRLAAVLPAKRQGATDFLGVYDLNGDGLSEILFGEQVFQNQGGGQFSARPLSAYRNVPLQSAVLGDFNSDGRVDLLCADPGARPQLLLADNEGRFARVAKEIDAVEPIREFSTSITVADVDQNGQLDVFLTQYKRPYLRGQMPSPYYDANDGHPAYLLINDGHGNFVDRTVAWGLAAKRQRRTYSSSFFDWDNDLDPDLMVVSDFAGLDLYEHTGNRFREVTSALVDQSHNFGMSHAIADFDGDGRLDFFVCGMGSTTARRLDAMGTGPPQQSLATRMRKVMGYGNRMYLAGEVGFQEPAFRDRVARTGWSWGVAEFDFDNDGDRDIYVGNGHISGPSVRDYCSVFWRHDIYAGDSGPNPALAQLFLAEQQEFGQQGSWNGYEHNCLLMNQHGSDFVEVAFLLGLAHEFDTRAVVADDIDANGLVDLLIVQRPVGRSATLQVWKNYFAAAGHWIGFALADSPRSSSSGATVVVTTSRGDQIASVVNGDSFNCQHAATLHFGLGEIEQVERVKVSWSNGSSQILRAPEIDRYHRLSAP